LISRQEEDRLTGSEGVEERGVRFPVQPLFSADLTLLLVLLLLIPITTYKQMVDGSV
jgi:hypothetical protein